MSKAKKATTKKATIADRVAAKRAAEKERRIANAKLTADAREARKATKLATKEAKPDLEKTESKPPVETKKKAKKAPKPEAPAKVGKGASIVALMQREGGATSAELMAASGWQRHSLRGFISAVVAKKMGLKVTTSKSEAGDFTYSASK